MRYTSQYDHISREKDIMF